MPIICTLAFPVYLVAFVICQQVIGRRFGIKNIPRQPSLVTELARAAGSVVMLVWVITLETTDSITYPGIRVVGIVIVLIGLFISMWAQRELGQYWVGGVGLHRGHKLITSGPYRFVRHPLYAGMIVSVIGVGLVGLNVLYFLMSFLMGATFFLRAPAEERLLQKKFKKKYDQYAAGTGMLIPRFGRRS